MPMRMAWIGWLVSLGFWALIAWRLRQIRGALLFLDAGASWEPDAAAEPPPPRVSLLVPARNEEGDVGESLRTMLAQRYPALEVILVDDQSDDRTVAVAAGVGAEFPAADFRILRGAPRPDGGWMGKTWALTQAVAAAHGEWLLFCDADVRLHPEALLRALRAARRLGVDALSLLPAIDCRSFWDQTIMPLFALLSALMEPPDKANRTDERNCRFSGAFILIRRAAYDRAGGHAAVRGEILEDMALARALKRAAVPLRLMYTHELVRTRMYENRRDMWHGLTRLAYPMLKFAPGPLLGAWAAAIAGAWLPWLSALAGAARGGRAGWGLAAAAAALVVWQAGMQREFYRLLRLSPLHIMRLPLAALVMCVAATASAWRHHTGRGARWKGRVCPPARG